VSITPITWQHIHAQNLFQTRFTTPVFNAAPAVNLTGCIIKASFRPAAVNSCSVCIIITFYLICSDTFSNASHCRKRLVNQREKQYFINTIVIDVHCHKWSIRQAFCHFHQLFVITVSSLFVKFAAFISPVIFFT
jgi:hypothetical protein